MSSSLQKKAIFGSIWILIGHGISQILRVISNVILTRLLSPDLFGLMALVKTFLSALDFFSDVGIRPSIIRSDHGDERSFLNTAWTVQVFRGFGLWFLTLLLAIPVANFYEDKRLEWIVPIVGVTMIMAGFNSTSIISLTRELNNKKLTIFNLVLQVISLTITIVWAYFNRSIWSLIVGSLISSLIQTFWSHFLDEKYSNRFYWNKKAADEIITYGRKVFYTTATTFLSTQSDRMVIGKIFNLSTLGIYTVAATFAEVPKMIIGKLANQVIMPVIAKQKHLPRTELRAKIIKKRWLLLLPLGLLVTLTSCFGDLLVTHLYDVRYYEAAWMLPILSLGFWPFLLIATIEKAIYVVSDPRCLAVGNFFKFTFNIVAIPLCFYQFGVLGAIIAIAINDFPVYIALVYGLWREKLTAIKQDCLSTLLLAVSIAIVLSIRYFSGFGLPIDILLNQA